MHTEIVLYMPCMLIYTFTCSYMYVNIRQYVHSFIHTCIYIYYHILYTYKHRHMHKHTHAETCMHGCILTYIPTPNHIRYILVFWMVDIALIHFSETGVSAFLPMRKACQPELWSLGKQLAWPSRGNWRQPFMADMSMDGKIILVDGLLMLAMLSEFWFLNCLVYLPLIPLVRNQ